MIIELGRLAREVELKQVNINGDDKLVFNNAIAIRADRDNTVFVDITAWGKLAELICEHLKKGDELLVKGELRNKNRKINDEVNITVPYILMTGFEFTHGKKRLEEIENSEEK